MTRKKQVSTATKKEATMINKRQIKKIRCNERNWDKLEQQRQNKDAFLSIRVINSMK